MSSLIPLQPLAYPTMPVPPKVLGPKGRFAWVKLVHLRIDTAYQRDVLENGKSNIRAIVEKFDWRKFGVLEVGERGPKEFAIIDGQHRALAALLVGVAEVPCLIQPGGMRTEAEAFAAINAKVTRISPLQSFHADVAAGDPESVALVELCAKAGVTIARRPKIDFKPGETMALRLLRTAAAKEGDLLLVTLKLLRAIDPKAGLGADELRGGLAALRAMDNPLKEPEKIGATIAQRGGETYGGGLAQLLAEAKARKVTRGGAPWQNFQAILTGRIQAAGRTSLVSMDRLMAGR